MQENGVIDTESVQYWDQRATYEIATKLAQFPACEYRGDQMVPVYGPERHSECTPEQIAAVRRSYAMVAVRALIRTGHAQQGAKGARAVVEAVTNFFCSSGMIYRLRVMEMENNHRTNSAKLSIDKVPAVFPSRISLWVRPTIRFDARGEGRDSMETTDRQQLIEAASNFYRSGIRCIWFEKILVEALLCAELYATIKYAKTQPGAWTGSPSMIRGVIASWAYGKSRGGDPLYTALILVGNLVILLVKIALWAYFSWRAYSASLIDANGSHVVDLLWMVLLGSLGVSAIGKWLVRLIVKWGTPKSESNVFLRMPAFGRALSALVFAHKDIMESEMSTTAARDALRRAFAEHAFVDAVAVAYLDRAIQAGEFLWSGQVHDTDNEYADAEDPRDP